MTPTRDDLALLATAVMGWKQVEMLGWLPYVQIGLLTLWPEDDPHIHKHEGWNPYESDADAMGLLDAMAGKPKLEVTLLSVRDENSEAFGWVFSIRHIEDLQLWSAESAVDRHAICAAALAWARGRI